MAKKKIRWPEVEEINGIPFTINYQKKVKDDAGNECCGLTDGPAHWMKISTDECPSPSMVESTLLHEIIHSILYVSGQSAIIDDEKVEEGIVTALENGLIQIYKRR
jgi:hypothetical protein